MGMGNGVEGNGSFPEPHQGGEDSKKNSQRAERQPETSGSGGPKTPDDNGGKLSGEREDRIVEAVEKAADKIAGETKTQAVKTRDHLTKLNEDLVNKLEQIRSLQEQLKNAPDPTLISDAMD